MLFKTTSLLDRINGADDINELESLISEGSRYKYATNNTRNKWLKAAKLRVQELSKTKRGTPKQTREEQI